MGLIAKSILPILVYILPYELWLCCQRYGFDRVICILNLKTVNLTSWTKCRLAAQVPMVEIKPIVAHYGIGHW